MTKDIVKDNRNYRYIRFLKILFKYNNYIYIYIYIYIFHIYIVFQNLVGYFILRLVLNGLNILINSVF